MSWSEETCPEPAAVEPMYPEHETAEPSEPGLRFVQWFRDPDGVKYKRLRDQKGKTARVVWKRWRD